MQRRTNSQKSAPGTRARSRNISVRMVRRESIDLQKLARALLAYDREQQLVRTAMRVAHLDPSLPQPSANSRVRHPDVFGDVSQRPA